MYGNSQIKHSFLNSRLNFKERASFLFIQPTLLIQGLIFRSLPPRNFASLNVAHPHPTSSPPATPPHDPGRRFAANDVQARAGLR